AELQNAIEQAIGQLPETQRMALVLRRYEELSYEDIADVLDLSVPAVKSLLFRARTELRERLKVYLEQ
ncbi:MAG TPA: sigma-70 family RNA polymerase sigma factor, partial [Chthoniobacterales bacterium]|nr:sigma-70 family RNA polymerase sigma factor [Chthoniobacterales bacterium]